MIMETRRIFVDKAITGEGLVGPLTGPLYRYVTVVLRKTKGDRIDLFDSGGSLHHCIVDDVKQKGVYLRILDTVLKPAMDEPLVTLCISPVKGARMDWLIEKATELGVHRIVPVIFSRTVVRRDDQGEKFERWKRIAVEAVRQSGRVSIPEIFPPCRLEAILPVIGETPRRLVLYEKEKDHTLHQFFSSHSRTDIAAVIGPEGGIEDGEIRWLYDHDFTPCTLGSHILRSETTPLVLLSIILYELGRQ